MSSRYLEMVRGQRRNRGGGFQFTAKSLLVVLAVCAMIGSAVYWWGIQSVLTPNKMIAGSFTLILVLAPPSLVSFLIPWSPAGMLLQKIKRSNARLCRGRSLCLDIGVLLVHLAIPMVGNPSRRPR